MKIMMVWELGNGFGHIARLLPIASGLQQLGHDIVWVIPKMTAISRLPPNSTIVEIPQFKPPSQGILTTTSLIHILYNMGYEQEEQLTSVVECWNKLFDTHIPDMILVDYSPSALIANLTRRIPMFHIGDGFTIPPQVKPYGVLIPSSNMLDDRGVRTLIEAEDRMLQVVNKVISQYDISPIHSFSEIYGVAPNAALLSYPELDHYGYRDAGYYGVLTADGNDALIKYPNRKHILVYLKTCNNIDHILKSLYRSNHALSVYISQPELPKKWIAKLKSRKNTKVYRGAVNFERAGEVCDLMISHGNHTTTAQALMVGLPILAIPIDKEKIMVTDRIHSMGSGLGHNPANTNQFIPIIDELLTKPKYKQNAQAFKKKYKDFDPTQSMKSLVDRIEAVGLSNSNKCNRHSM